MRVTDKINQKRRFEMFNTKSKEKVLELNSFFGKYIMHFEERIKKTFIYYDTPNKDLEKSNIVLFKTIIGNFTELNMATEQVNTNYHYTLRNNSKQFKKAIKPHDSILKHKDFLIDSFTSMFLSGISFDPEFLMRKLQPVYTIETISSEYRSMNLTGLKITYSFDQDKYINHINQQVAFNDVLTIYQHSNDLSNPDFEDLISKLTRYCKELTSTNETKIMIARRSTVQKVAPVKEFKEDEKPTKKDKKKKK